MDTAIEFVRTLRTAHVGLVTALESVIEVEADLATMASQPHLTTDCHAGEHALCFGTCSCHLCQDPCECTCHLIVAGLRTALGA